MTDQLIPKEKKKFFEKNSKPKLEIDKKTFQTISKLLTVFKFQLFLDFIQISFRQKCFNFVPYPICVNNVLIRLVYW